MLDSKGNINIKERIEEMKNNPPKERTIDEAIDDMDKLCKEYSGLRYMSRIYGGLLVYFSARFLLPDLLSSEPYYPTGLVAIPFMIEGVGDIITGQHHYVSLHTINYIKKGYQKIKRHKKV